MPEPSTIGLAMIRAGTGDAYRPDMRSSTAAATGRRQRWRLTAVALGAWAATAGCTLLAPMRSLLVVVAAAGVAVLLRCRWLCFAVAVGVGCGAASAAMHVRALQHGVVPALARSHGNAELVARLVRDPVSDAASGAPLFLTDATVIRVWQGRWTSASSPVLLLSYGSGWAGLLPGQLVDVTGGFALPRRGEGLAAVIDVRGSPLLLGRPPWWQRLAGRVRRALDTACRRLPADERGLVPGLIDGDVSAMPAALTADMRLTGLTHLEAVSGENVTVVLMVASGLAASLGMRRRARVLTAAVTLLGFVVLARPSPSVLRAAVMGGLALLGMVTGRRAAVLPTLSVAVTALVLIDPFLARSIGFVLSVLATASLVVLAPSLTRRLAVRMRPGIAALIAVPTAAQLGCLPVLVLAFGRLTPYAVPANLLAAPAVAPATIAGVACAAVAAIARPLAAPIAWIAALPAFAIAEVARGLARLPAAGARLPSGGAAVLVAVTLVALLATTTIVVRRRPAHEILGRWPP